MADTHLLLVAAAALVDNAGRVLVQQRPAGKSLAGLWEFPGGKIEPGGTPEEALVRELAEELAIAVDTAACVPAAFASEQVGTRHLLLLLYQVRAWRGEPRAMEASTLRWATPAELSTLPMPAPDRPLLAALAARLAG